MKKLIALVLMGMMSLAMLAGCGSKTVSLDLSTYMNVLFSGADGQGKARADFDYSGMEKAIMAGSKEGEGALSNILKLESTMTLSVDPNKNLKNGDKVTMTVSFDKEAAKSAGVLLSGGSKEFTVSGLGSSGAVPTPDSSQAGTDKATEPASIELDAFDPAYWNTDNGIVVRYEGTSPFGSLELTNNLPAENPLSKVNYQFSEYQKLHEGDKVTVTVSFKDTKMKDQYYFKELTGTYTVGPVDHFMMDAAELDKETAAALQQAAQSIAANAATGILEFRTADDYKGFYNGEAVTVESNEAGSSLYLIRERDSHIDTIVIPAYLHVTVTEPDWMENHKTYEYDLVFLSRVQNVIVHADGSVATGDAELAGKATADAEDKLMDEMQSWFTDPIVEKVELN